MGYVTSIVYEFDGTGSEIPALSINDSHQEIFLTGAATAIGSYTIVPSGTPSQGNKVTIKYCGALDITSNAVTFSIFGTLITQNILNTVFEAECEYYDSQWNIIITPNITNFSLGPANIPANSITTAMIQNGAVTQPKLSTNAVNTVNIANLQVTQAKLALLSVGTPQLITSSVDSTIIANNAVTTTKILDGSVTNVKLATTTVNSVKTANVSGLITDIALGTDQLIGRLSGNVQAINRSSILSGTYEVINLIGNFTYGGLNPNVTFLPYECTIVNVLITVIESLSGTDDGLLEVIDGQTAATITSITVPASTSAGTTRHSYNIGYAYTPIDSTSILNFRTSKPTVGGKMLITMVVQRT